jgi:hypothetical protein
MCALLKFQTEFHTVFVCALAPTQTRQYHEAPSRRGALLGAAALAPHEMHN